MPRTAGALSVAPEARTCCCLPSCKGVLALRVHEHDGAFEWQQYAVPAGGQLRLREKENAARVLGGKVDAAVALRSSEAVVPVGAVQRVALFVVEILHVRHFTQLELLSHLVRAH